MKKDLKELRNKLTEPFNEDEIEWRVQSCGIKNGKAWAKVLCYIEARAIQNRLDEVFGFNHWREEYRAVGGNMICRLSVKLDDGWIYKENGASETAVESFKGGISSAFKRVSASGYGIGRYLYNLPEQFAECTIEKPSDIKSWKVAKTKEQKIVYWKVPKLPDWALPKERNDIKNGKEIKTNRGTLENNVCEDCGRELSKNEITYSQRYYDNHKYCRDCQKNHSKAS